MGQPLKELADAYEEHERRRGSAKQAGKRRYLGHRTNYAFYAIILCLLLTLAIILLAQRYAVADLEERHRQALLEVSALESEVARLEEAYRIAAEDAEAFSRLHGIAFNDTGEQGDRRSEAGEAATLPGESAWEAYREAGFITDECLGASKLVRTPGEEVEIAVVASAEEGTGWPTLTLLVDGTVIDAYPIASSEEEIRTSRIRLPKGTHYLDIIRTSSDGGPVRVSLLRIGDRTLETGLGLIDHGSGFAMFDCEETARGNLLEREGALRFRIEKA